ncbi:MAG: hypothetical protein HYW48_06765 [Deltaproteobacteria bacterium]|nr:hypothetical protein [Deltaproteobacteria bacterium]
MKTINTVLAVLLAFFVHQDLLGKKNTMYVSFENASCFNADFSQYPAQIRYFGSDEVRLVPFGPAVINWTVTLAFTPIGIQFVEGAFVYTFRSGNQISGNYTGATVNPFTGEYTLEWTFTEGSGGVFEIVDEGVGETAGIVDLFSFCAEYRFSGTLDKDPKDGGEFAQAARRAAKAVAASLKK